jgi:hypothetical protein
MPVGSDAPLHVAISLISGGQVFVFPGHQYFRSLSVELSAGGSWTGTIELYDSQGDYLENIIIAAGLDRRIRFTFGRGDEHSDENLTFEGNITTYRPTFEANGVSLTMEAVAVGVVSALVNRKPKAFPEGRTLSSMVEELAALNGWATTDALGRKTIEATSAVMKEPYTSTGESDVKFIREQLCAQATNSSNQGHYLFFFDEANTVHFHTPDFLPAIQHEFVYARKSSGDVISFSPSDVSLFGMLMGGGNSIFTGMSSLAGAPAQVTSTSTGGVENEGFPVVPDASNRLDYGDAVHSYVNLSTRDTEELKRLAQTRYDKFREYGFKADMEVFGTHRVRLLDFVNVRFLKANPAPGTNPEHYLSGRFRIYKIKHEVSGEWKTTYEMLRGGVVVPGTQPVQATKQIVPANGSNTGSTIGLNVDA